MAKKETFSSIQQVDKAGALKKLGIFVGVIAAIVLVAGLIHMLRSSEPAQAEAPEAPTPAMVPSSIR